jgi:Cft2 family RNA processing exonuclease
MLVEKDGVRLLYSGDFKLRPGLSCETVEVPKADIVIMETTFARPRYLFPETEQVVKDIREWCESVLSFGEVPVLLCYSLGKGQEVLAGLKGASFPIYLQREHWKLTRVYQECGVEFPEFRRYEIGTPLQGALLCSGQCRRFRWFRDICASQRVRTAYISGWAMDPWRCKGTDAAFPLSDHAGYDDLLEYVRLTEARRVYSLHGFEDEFAADLRSRGLEAWPLREAAQAPQLTQLSLF